ncbi:sensor histidine kinase [Marinobacter sp.]|uniref:sensor histidine kinase n=1 Tax=Marinobacter sp. TaxID=50741 RepID=UPI002B279602|nr:ATP-binding protein [Marinobacter sp.]
MADAASILPEWLDMTFMGHGHCYLWRSDLLALHAISDTLIAVAYFTIPLALYVLLHKRKDIEFEWMFLLFALFIFCCGVTHLMAVYNIWNGAYYLSGFLKALTAVVSLITAALVWPLIPRALALPRPAQLQAANMELESEIIRRSETEQNLEKARFDLEGQIEELTRTKLRLEQEIEQRSRLEKQQQQQTRALERSNEDLEQFAFIASHDLREPLRKLMAFTQMLMTGKYGEFNEKGEQFVRYIREAAERMDALLNSLLSYSRISSSDEGHEDLSLHRIVDEACRDLQLSIEDSHAVIRVGDLCRVHGDPAQLRPLMQNLISNSLKYCSPDTPPVIEIAACQSDLPGRCEVTVTDNGIGFDGAYKDQVFEVFKRLHGRGEYEGTGMGLAICRKIVERHGGSISAESNEGQGARFRFDLPLAAESGGSF